MSQFVIGIDVGGTNVKLGIVSLAAKVIARTSFSTTSYASSKMRLINALVIKVADFLTVNNIDRRHVLGVGIGLPGLIDSERGIANSLPNIPGWNKFPIQKILYKKLHLPVYIDNDAHLMALGEWKYGAGKGAKNLICITLGTGIGGGLIFNNELYRGPGFAAGEIGHMPLNEEGPKCACGGYGCFEQYVGRTYLKKKTKKIFKKQLEWVQVSALANQGDKRAIKIWKETAQHLGNGLTGVVNLLNPLRIVIGGGVSNCPAFVYKIINQVIKKRAMKVQASMVKVVKAKLGNDAALIGAKVLVELFKK